MRKERVFLFFSIMVLILLIFFGPVLGWRVRDFLAGRGELSDIERLSLRNQKLEAELMVFSDVRSQMVGQMDGVYLPALVFAQYPFNFKSEVLISGGERVGVMVEAAVVAGVFYDGEDVDVSRVALLGKIEEVWSNKSLVRTIFDSNWKSEVRVGEKGYPALLQGGLYPRLTLVDKSSVLQKGDLVYSADDRFPYGLPIGRVESPRLTDDKLFKEADLVLGYKFEDLRIVGIFIGGNDGASK